MRNYNSYLFRKIIFVSNSWLRKNVLTENNIEFNERLSSTADRYFLVQLASVAKGKMTDEAPLLYRISDNSMSNKFSKKLVLDNEQYFIELKKNKLVPEAIHTEFLFYIQYILGIAFIKTGLYRKGIQYALSCFIKTPRKFLKRLFIN